MFDPRRDLTVRVLSLRSREAADGRVAGIAVERLARAAGPPASDSP